MKGILVFDELNDVIFMKMDESLQQHFYTVGVQNGLINPKENDKLTKHSISKDVMVQLFSPLIASQKVMQAQFFNMYRTVECNDGTVMVFTEFLNYLFIGIGNLEEDTLCLVRRRLGIFVSLVKILYGPAIHLMKEIESYDKRCHFLSKLLDTWECLRKKEQTFLVEAIERLLVTTSLSTECINLLQKVLEKMRSVDSNQDSICHSFLLVESKLLAFYSSRNAVELSKSSLLMLILLALTTCSSLDEYKNIFNSTKLSDRESLSSKQQSSNSEEYFTPQSSISSRMHISENENVHNKDIQTDLKVSEENLSLITCMDITDIYQVLVFLSSENDSAVPYMVYIVRVLPKMILIIVSEVSVKVGISSSLVNVLDILHNIIVSPIEKTSENIANTLEINMKKFFENSKKIKLEQLLERRVKNLMSKWEQLKRNNFLEFLHNSNELLMPARLETAITAICEDIQTMFELIVFEPEILHQIKPDNAIICALLQVQEISSSKLMDYIDYLVVKAQQNISMTSYIQDFPGLIHFIYVDRTRNYIVTPSVRISEHYTEGNNMTNITKRLIWKMVDFSYEYLESNHLSAMWREENYCFSYFLWFEDANVSNLI
ncbi:Hermansky-Pudlak syndrome 1 protein homolog isoform X1 [Centruroides sculpturatus]|uniref:Hermansky-Pudlak syndrome 1 protein homolog isoform X1 n=1 Tax=Centruroides sculpturatus TaxID=218467 RepID=UPI000C6D0281|nr:Hermansky-Pudlak syndrome 1 protein homolog isoform X1 [Centruroides sculpturatus]